MRRLLPWLAVGALTASGAPPARASDPLSEQLQFAARQDDLGYRAYVAKQFEQAATHFEDAFFAAPNPAELRKAIRARRESGALARAATLAAIGQRRYTSDAALLKTAEEAIAEARPKVFEVRVTSREECNVAVDAKVVTTEPSRDARFFVDPGKHEMLVGWSDHRATKVSVDAEAGGHQTLELVPPAAAPSTAPAEHPGNAGHAKPLGPGVFLVGAGLTAAGLGVTIWSGIDALDQPGKSAVKADCVGQGTACPQYQQGVDAQRRTNILIAGTALAGATTLVVGAFLTRWSSSEQPRASSAKLRIEPVVGPDRLGVMGTF